MSIFCRLQALLDRTRAFDFLGPLALRLYLAPIFLMAGGTKYKSFSDTVEWFGNPDWGLGLPAPEVMAFLATGTELAGAVMLLIGLGTRWISMGASASWMFPSPLCSRAVSCAPRGMAKVADVPAADNSSPRTMPLFPSRTQTIAFFVPDASL